MARRPLYVLPGSNPGLLVRGNIDINNRPSVPNPQGGMSSVFSASCGVDMDGREVQMLYPTVIPAGAGKWQIVSRDRGCNYAIRTGKHLGIFDTIAHAKAYANRLHLQQARLGQQDKFRNPVRQ